MKKLIEQRYTIRRNLLAIIGICLCVYFAWHALAGERGVIRLVSVEHKIEKLEREVAELRAVRVELEGRVVLLRPNSLDPDMLEERARLILGFQYPDEQLILR